MPSMNTGSNGLTAVIGQDAGLVQLATGFEFVEGPTWIAEKRELVFSDIIGNAMYRLAEDGGVSEFRKPSNMANGTTRDREGRLLICEHASSCVSRVDASGCYEVLASHYEGLELNSPNDIVVKSNGDIYFSDPASGRTEKYGVERKQQLDFQGVFRLDAGSGALDLLADDFILPNGLCFSLDESRLFVNDTRRQHIREFRVLGDGRLDGGRIWAQTGGALPGVADGMKLDVEGNLYCCGSGGIHVFDPGGKRLGVIGTHEVAANFTWGGEDLADLYITATNSIYRLRMKIAGHQPINPLQ